MPGVADRPTRRPTSSKRPTFRRVRLADQAGVARLGVVEQITAEVLVDDLDRDAGSVERVVPRGRWLLGKRLRRLVDGADDLDESGTLIVGGRGDEQPTLVAAAVQAIPGRQPVLVAVDREVIARRAVGVRPHV